MSAHTSDAAPLIEGRYRIVGSLGEGGMAVVYRAWDTRLRAWRAVKFLLPDFARRKAIRRRFESEAYAMARLDHPNVVRVYDVGQAGELPFIAMELVEGGSLDGWTARNGRMPQQQAIRAVIQVCAGLSAAHAEGIIHRDVKPQNILVDRRGLCKVTDFGIAQVEDSTSVHTREGASMGTAGFMAPEQRTDASSTDQRADVFSTGATLFSLLTGGERTLDLYAVEAEELVADGLHPAVAAVVLRASRYRREERYATCAELAAALEEILPTLPPDPLTVPLEVGAPPTAPSELTPVPESFTLPDGILPSVESPAHTNPTFPPQSPIEPPAPRERAPVVLPYQMPKVEGQRSNSRSDTDALPDYVDAASVKDAPSGFDVELAEADRLATERARRAKLETEKEGGSGTSTFEGEEGAKTVGRFLYEIVASTLSVLIRPLALLSVIGSAVGAIALGGLWFAAAPLREAEANARSAQRAYFGAIGEESPRIRDDLVELGARPAPMDDLIARYASAPDPASRLATAGRLDAFLHAEADGRRDQISPALGYKLQHVDQRLDALERLSETVRSRMLAWEDAADEPSARAAIQLGLATEPD